MVGVLDSYLEDPKISDQQKMEMVDLVSLKPHQDQIAPDLIATTVLFSYAMKNSTPQNTKQKPPALFVIGSLASFLQSLHEERFNEKNSEEKMQTLERILKITKKTGDLDVAILNTHSLENLPGYFSPEEMEKSPSKSQPNQTRIELKIKGLNDNKSNQLWYKVDALEIVKDPETGEKIMSGDNGKKIILQKNIEDKLRYIEIAGVQIYFPKFHFLMATKLEINKGKPAERHCTDTYNLLGYMVNNSGLERKYQTNLEKILYLNWKLETVQSDIERLYEINQLHPIYKQGEKIQHPIDIIEYFILETGIISALLKQKKPEETKKRIEEYAKIKEETPNQIIKDLQTRLENYKTTEFNKKFEWQKNKTQHEIKKYATLYNK